MVKKYGFFLLFILLSLVGRPADGQVYVENAWDVRPANTGGRDCRRLLRPFTTASLTWSLAGNITDGQLLAGSAWLTPLAEEETVPVDQADRYDRAEKVRRSGMFFSGLGLSVLCVTGVVYLGQYLATISCQMLSSCSSVTGVSTDSPGEIKPMPYIISLSIGGTLTLIGLSMIIAAGAS